MSLENEHHDQDQGHGAASLLWGELRKRPIYLELRSSTGFIGITAFVAAFTDGFLYSTVVPVLPFSLVDRSGVAEENAVAGWFADHSSSRQAPLLTGLGLAFAATLLFALACAPWILVIARVFQGFSASIIYTAGLALIADTVPAKDVGSWMGFVLSGMNGGALVAPFIAGAIYDCLGYYAVWISCLLVITFDLVLRLAMVEKSRAREWLDPQQTVERQDAQGAVDEEAPLLPEVPKRQDQGVPISDNEANDAAWPIGKAAKEADLERSNTSWFRRKFPAMAILLGSPRILAAVYGCFTHTTLISSFDAVLALFVKRTFGWSSTGAGLIFLAITVPSTLGAFIGALSDRYGTRKVALFGFGLTIPSLALLGVVTDASIAHQAALIVLLVSNGIGLNFILAPLAADMFDEVEDLANSNREIFGEKGAFARAYSLFDAALGIATVVGPAWSGAFYAGTTWYITAISLALLCALGGVPVLMFTERSRVKPAE